MIKFILKIFKFIFTIFIIFLIFTYIFSLKSNMSFQNTIVYFGTVAKQILNINNSENITVNNTTDDLTVVLYDNKYYYNQLDNTGKIIYSALENNIDNFKKDNYTIDFSTTFNNLLNTTTGQYKLNRSFQSALDAFFYDHPELFYIDLTRFSLNTKCISIAFIKTYTVEIVPKYNSYLHSYFKSEQEVNLAIKQVEDIKNRIIDNLSDSSIYNRIKEVHDILVNTIEYDSTLRKNNTHNIYGALIEKQVVCDGYAKAFKYIMDSLNIESILVSGTATNTSGKSESHIWNYVKLNNNWYGVDVTWDDPVVIGGYLENNLRHNYFLKGRNTFLPSHKSSGKISETGMLFAIPTLSNSNYR